MAPEIRASVSVPTPAQESCADHVPENRDQTPEMCLPAVALARPLEPLGPKPLVEVATLCEIVDALGQDLRVPRREVQRGRSANFAVDQRVRGDHRHTARHGFYEGESEGLRDRWKYEDIARAVQRRQCLRVDAAERDVAIGLVPQQRIVFIDPVGPWTELVTIHGDAADRCATLRSQNRDGARKCQRVLVWIVDRDIEEAQLRLVEAAQRHLVAELRFIARSEAIEIDSI